MPEDNRGITNINNVDKKMEEDHVHAVYEVIASHFSDTRFAVWPKVILNSSLNSPFIDFCAS